MKKLCLVPLILLLLSVLPLGFHPAYAVDTPNLAISPNKSVTQDTNFTLDVKVSNVSDMIAWSVTLKFRKIIQVLNVLPNTTFFDNAFFDYNYENLTYNYYKLDVFSTTFGDGVDGSGTIAHINFTATYKGLADLQILSTEILDSDYENVTHTQTACTITVTGSPSKTFLQVDPVSNGVLNITEGTYIYDATSIITIQATQTSGVFQYFILDGVLDYANPIDVSMSDDHQIGAIFEFPILTVHTSEPSMTIYFGSQPYTTNSSGYVLIQRPIGVYQLVASKADFYTHSELVNLSSDKTMNIELFQVKYYIEIPASYKTSTFTGSVPPGIHYIDSESLIEVSSETTATIKLTIHYDTNYPIIEIESENISKIRFDLAELYSKYCGTSYENMIKATQFTGLKIDSNIEITVEILMWKYPKEIWKMLPNEKTPIIFSNWTYANNLVTLTLKPGDPTLSMLFPFPSGINPSVLVMFQVVLPIVALVGFAMVFFNERPKDVEDIVVYAVAFIVIGVIIPIAINFMVNG